MFCSDHTAQDGLEVCRAQQEQTDTGSSELAFPSSGTWHPSMTSFILLMQTLLRRRDGKNLLLDPLKLLTRKCGAQQAQSIRVYCRQMRASHTRATDHVGAVLRSIALNISCRSELVVRALASGQISSAAVVARVRAISASILWRHRQQLS